MESPLTFTGEVEINQLPIYLDLLVFWHEFVTEGKIHIGTASLYEVWIAHVWLEDNKNNLTTDYIYILVVCREESYTHLCLE